MPSFDVVSELDKHELTNAVDNAIKELDRRFDLRGKCSIESKDKTLTLTAEAEFMLEQVLDIVRASLIKRKIDCQCMEAKDAYASGKVMKQEVTFREGIDKELAKKIDAQYPPSATRVWAQEEPRNAGAYLYIADVFREKLDIELGYIGRPASASPATGSEYAHKKQPEKILSAAIGALAGDAKPAPKAPEPAKDAAKAKAPTKAAR